MSINLRDSAYFIDRELSWLAFNERVLEEAEDATTPLLERVRFVGITSSNLDEFFMVRVSGVQEQIMADVRQNSIAGNSPTELLSLLHARIHIHVDRMYRCLNSQLLPALEEHGVRVRRVRDLTGEQARFAAEIFQHDVYPVLTPLAVDSGHPFPHLRNLSLNVAVRLEAPGESGGSLFAVVQVPSKLERVMRLPGDGGAVELILMEDLISAGVEKLFPGLRVAETSAFRLTRDADIEFAEEEAEDLLKTIEQELRSRERGSAVRLSVEKSCSEELADYLCNAVSLQRMQLYRVDGPINLAEVAQSIVSRVNRDDLKFRPFTPTVRRSLRNKKDLFAAIAAEDVLVHHPFESFAPVVDFIEQAAHDPNVLAIKQTLYRTSGDSAIVKALMLAAEQGKQVAALMELKARFDEERNIVWARQMERAGVHVVYGLVGLKTHAKLALVVRKEDKGIRRYVHLATGNYNPITARIYTDLGLFSSDPELCDDASELFNLLTGYSANPQFKKTIVAPLAMRETMVALIEAEREKAQRGAPARIRLKLNSLADQDLIVKLYEASNAGVPIDLIVRGICCLRPGIPGVSENIRVSSIVDRFLEHTRIFIFGEGAEERVFLSSGDWMPRNLDRRVEVTFPIENPALKHRIVQDLFQRYLADNMRRRVLASDGTYARVVPSASERPRRSQFELLEAEETSRARESSPEVLVAQAAANAAANAPTSQRRGTLNRAHRVPVRSLLFRKDEKKSGAPRPPHQQLGSAGAPPVRPETNGNPAPRPTARRQNPKKKEEG